MIITANAKINLCLDVGAKRPDGFHEVNMIMQTLVFGDIVTVKKHPGSIELCGTGDKIAYDETNLAYKAAKKFFESSGIAPGAKIFIDKQIPICAGLAGGSSDAAAVLEGLNRIYECPFDTQKLIQIGMSIGSDVPFCITKGTALATGRGEILTPLAPIKQKTVVLVKPDINVSTPKAYSLLDNCEYKHPDVSKICKMINKNEFEKSYPILENVFENVIFEQFAEVRKIKDSMRRLGADAALMSGSGPTVFGIFENEKNAEMAYNEFKAIYNDAFVTKTFNV